MRYPDFLYGDWDMPDFLCELTDTPEMQRLHNISQSVLPRNIMPYGVASRFEHSLGVARLATEVVTRNEKAFTAQQALLLPVAALFHDAGNPALSHLSEPFLRQATGYDGESFLGEMLRGTESAALIEKLGLSVYEVVQCVTGKTAPYSKVLNGSIDIDNLDNVGRYWYMAHPGEILFDAHFIAYSYRFKGNYWEFDRACFDEVRKWQEARRAVYGTIYGYPHLNAAQMAWYAVAIAFFYEQLPAEFFRLDDNDAFDFLSRVNGESAWLVKRVRAREWYEEIASIETTEPTKGFRDLAGGSWDGRIAVNEYIREQVRIPRRAICTYFGKGRDVRRIDLPFTDEHGSVSMDDNASRPLYRLKVYVDPEFRAKKESIERWVRYVID